MITELSTEELEQELLRRRGVEERINQRIWEGDLVPTDGDDIHDRPESWRNQ